MKFLRRNKTEEDYWRKIELAETRACSARKKLADLTQWQRHPLADVLLTRTNKGASVSYATIASELFFIFLMFPFFLWSPSVATFLLMLLIGGVLWFRLARTRGFSYASFSHLFESGSDQVIQDLWLAPLAFHDLVRIEVENEVILHLRRWRMLEIFTGVLLLVLTLTVLILSRAYVHPAPAAFAFLGVATYIMSRMLYLDALLIKRARTDAVDSLMRRLERVRAGKGGPVGKVSKTPTAAVYHTIVYCMAAGFFLIHGNWPNQTATALRESVQPRTLWVMGIIFISLATVTAALRFVFASPVSFQADIPETMGHMEYRELAQGLEELKQVNGG